IRTSCDAYVLSVNARKNGKLPPRSRMPPHTSLHSGRRGVQPKRTSSAGKTIKARKHTFIPMRIATSARDSPPVPGMRMRSASSAGSLERSHKRRAAAKETHQAPKTQPSTQRQSPDSHTSRAANPRMPTGTATTANPVMIGVGRIGSRKHHTAETCLPSTAGADWRGGLTGRQDSFGGSRKIAEPGWNETAFLSYKQLRTGHEDSESLFDRFFDWNCGWVGGMGVRPRANHMARPPSGG